MNLSPKLFAGACVAALSPWSSALACSACSGGDINLSLVGAGALKSGSKLGLTFYAINPQTLQRELLGKMATECGRGQNVPVTLNGGYNTSGRNHKTLDFPVHPGQEIEVEVTREEGDPFSAEYPHFGFEPQRCALDTAFDIPGDDNPPEKTDYISVPAPPSGGSSVFRVSARRPRSRAELVGAPPANIIGTVSPAVRGLSREANSTPYDALTHHGPALSYALSLGSEANGAPTGELVFGGQLATLTASDPDATSLAFYSNSENAYAAIPARPTSAPLQRVLGLSHGIEVNTATTGTLRLYVKARHPTTPNALTGNPIRTFEFTKTGELLATNTEFQVPFASSLTIQDKPGDALQPATNTTKYYATTTANGFVWRVELNGSLYEEGRSEIDAASGIRTVTLVRQTPGQPKVTTRQQFGLFWTLTQNDGIWNTSANYSKCNIVSYNNNYWEAKSPSGPSNGGSQVPSTSNPDYWRPVTKRTELMTADYTYPDGFGAGNVELSTIYTYSPVGKLQSLKNPNESWSYFTHELTVDPDNPNHPIFIEKEYKPYIFYTATPPTEPPTSGSFYLIERTYKNLHFPSSSDGGRSRFFRHLFRETTSMSAAGVVNPTIISRTDHARALEGDIEAFITTRYASATETLKTITRRYRMDHYDSSEPHDWYRGRLYSTSYELQQTGTNSDPGDQYVYTYVKLPSGHQERRDELPRQVGVSTRVITSYDARERITEQATYVCTNATNPAYDMAHPCDYTIYAYDDSDPPKPKVTQTRNGVTISIRETLSPIQSRETDVEDLTTTTTYDDRGRPDLVARSSIDSTITISPSQSQRLQLSALTTDYSYSFTSSPSREIHITETSSSSAKRLRTESRFDLEGRSTVEIDVNGYQTTITYPAPSPGQHPYRAQYTYPNGATEERRYFPDGSLGSINGNAQFDQWTEIPLALSPYRPKRSFYRTNVEMDPYFFYHSQYTLDGIGRIHTSAPNWLDPIPEIISWFYGSDGQVSHVTSVASIEPQKATKRHGYDAWGRSLQAGLDVNGNGSLDVNQGELRDQSVRYDVDYDAPPSPPAQASALKYSLVTTDSPVGYWLTRRNHIPTSNGPTEAVTIRERVSDFSVGLLSERVEVDASGVTTRIKVWVDKTAHFTRTETTRSDSSLTKTRWESAGLLRAETSFTVPRATIYSYDQLRRLIGVSEPDRPSIFYLYVNHGSLYTGTLISQLGIQSQLLGKTWTYEYHPGGLVKSVTVSGVSPNQKTEYEYDSMGRLTHQWGAEGAVKYVYHTLGMVTQIVKSRKLNAVKTDLDGTIATGVESFTYYPYTNRVYEHYQNNTLAHRYEYDGLGLAVAWNLQNDAPPIINSVAKYYSRTPAGQIKSIWYHHAAPWHEDFEYDHAGRVRTVKDSSGERTLTYANDGSLTGDSISGIGVLTGFAVTKGWANGRPRSVQVTGPNGVAVTTDYTYEEGNSSDPIGRLSWVATGPSTVALGTSKTRAVYDYYPGSDLVRTIGFKANNGSLGIGSFERTYRADGFVQNVTGKKASGDEITRSYLYDGIGRRSKRTDDDSARVEYAYNDKGELRVAKRIAPSHSDNPSTAVMAGQNYVYAYDGAGNRTLAKRSGRQESAALPEKLDETTNGTPPSMYLTTYGGGTDLSAANSGNQYVSIANTDRFDVVGKSSSEVTLNVDGNSTTITAVGASPADTRRQGTYWREKYTSSPGLKSVSVTPTGGEPETGSIYVPPVSESLTHDRYGNLTADGRWVYTWDANHRLLSMETRSGSGITDPLKMRRLEFAYDWLGRRVQKIVQSRNAANSGWVATQTEKYVHDGWNLVLRWVRQARVVSAAQASGSQLTFTIGPHSLNQGDLVEIAGMAPSGYNGNFVVASKTSITITVNSGSSPGAATTMGTVTLPPWGQSFAWGTDISGTFTGAGGVGGLLMIDEINSTGGVATDKAHCVAHDGSGNVMMLMQDGSSTATARYDYGPFGEPARCSGSFCGKNPIRYSSKFEDDESGLVYYGYRYYNPTHGRWLSRDPIGEEGGLNLYGFVGNDPVNKWDYLGLVDWVVPPSSMGGAFARAYCENKTSGGLANMFPQNPNAPAIGNQTRGYPANTDFSKWFNATQSTQVQQRMANAQNAIASEILKKCKEGSSPLKMSETSFQLNGPDIMPPFTVTPNDQIPDRKRQGTPIQGGELPGDIPQTRLMSRLSLGRHTFHLGVVAVSQVFCTCDKCFVWSAELSVTDTPGVSSYEDSLVGNVLTGWGFLTDSPPIKIAKWNIGGTVCCPKSP